MPRHSLHVSGRIASILSLDKIRFLIYNVANCIGQFVTILSVNKTRQARSKFGHDGRGKRSFCFMGTV